MSLTNEEWGRILEHHGRAITQLTIANVEKLLYELKGTNEPQEPYAKGYRDAIDTMLIRLRQFNVAFQVQIKPEEME